jgi:hypothetical protein
MSNLRIVYMPRADTKSDAELNALAAVYRFALFISQTSKGGSHDLTNNSIAETVKNGSRNKEQENT